MLLSPLPVRMFLIHSLHDSLTHPLSVIGDLIHLTRGYNLPQPLTSFYDIHPSMTTHATPKDTTRLSQLQCGAPGTSGLSTYSVNTKTDRTELSYFCFTRPVTFF